MQTYNPTPNITAFKTIYILNDRGHAGAALRPTHYCCCLIAGRDPMWALWTVRGTFLRYAGSRQMLIEAYPEKAWSRITAAWTMTNDDNFADIGKRIAMLTDVYHAKVRRGADARMDPIEQMLADLEESNSPSYLPPGYSKPRTAEAVS